MKNIIKTTVVLSMVAMLSACGTIGPNNLDSNVLGQQGQVRTGRVIAIHQVAVKANTSYSGKALSTSIGAAAGAVLGSKVGEGRGKRFATTIGGLIGASAATMALESRADNGAQFILNIGGQTAAYTMIGNYDQTIRPGDRVQVVVYGMRVSNMHRL